VVRCWGVVTVAVMVGKVTVTVGNSYCVVGTVAVEAGDTLLMLLWSGV
jgi:hypothetical protein